MLKIYNIYADKQTKRQVYIKINAKVEHVYHHCGTCSLYKFGYIEVCRRSLQNLTLFKT